MEYFTPQIEDIRVGYECEIHLNGQWLHETIDYNDLHSLTRSIYGLMTDQAIEEKRIRVPYLTKEQIEAEGWKWEGELFSKGFYILNFMKDEITYPIQGIVVTIAIMDSEYGQRYLGDCKDINTFRYICKLLGI